MDRVVVVGNGNVAYGILRSLAASGDVELRGVVSRNIDKAWELASIFGIEASDFEGEIIDGDIYLVAVKDDAIEEVVNRLVAKVNPLATIAHTSGAAPLFGNERCGRFYPLQTFTKGVDVDFKKITIFIEAKCSKIEKRLLNLSKIMAFDAIVIDSQTLSKVHLAATFANNFTNHLLRCAQGLLGECGLSLNLLKPLVDEGLRKAFECEADLKTVQSGAAVREDFKTMERHCAMLSDDQKQIYKLISNNIIKIKNE